MVDMMLAMPVSPCEMTVKRLHGLAPTHHKGMRTIHVVGLVDMIRDFLRWVLGGIQVLTTEVCQTPVRGELANELLECLCEVRLEPCVVFKDHVRINALKQTLFKNE